ncbi:hypothetical protein ACFE04_017723 [Oxalis oulophora]
MIGAITCDKGASGGGAKGSSMTSLGCILKKGPWTAERIIIELHAKLGNKWARMAAQLPGRTDNEIKNYWNTRMKRRQRAGLPLYPQEVQEEAAAYHLEQEFEDQQPPNKRHHSSPSSPLTSLLISSTNTTSQPRKPSNNYNNNINNPFLNNAFSFSPSTNSLQLNHPNIIFSDTQFKLDSNNQNNNGPNYGKPLSTPLSSTSPSLYNQTLMTPPMNHHHHHHNHHTTPTQTSLYQLNVANAVPFHQFTTTTVASFDPSLMSFSSLLNMGAANPVALNHFENHKMVAEVTDEKEKGAPVDSSADDNEEEGDGENEQSNLVNGGQGIKAEVHWEDLSSSHSSTGLKKTNEEATEAMNSMDDDDLQSLLTNFPSEMPPVPDWYPKTDNNGETSNGSSSSNINHEAGVTMNPDLVARPTSVANPWNNATAGVSEGFS